MPSDRLFFGAFAAGAFAMSALAGYAWLTSDHAPTKGSLASVEGVVTRIEYAHTSRSSAITGIGFWLSGDTRRFYYVGFLPSFQEAKALIVPGAQVQLDLAEGHDIWGIRVNEEQLADYDEIAKAHHENGNWGGIVSIAAALAGVYMLRQAR